MLKKLITSLFILYAMTSIEFVSAEKPNSSFFNNSSEEGHIYNLSICATFNNEAYHLKEWIDHHQLLGVEHFYLYNLGSKDHFLFVLIPYINEGLVTLVNWPCPQGQNETNDAVWTLGTKVPAYENAVNFLAKEETRWLVIVDIDEFLICPKGNLADLLLDYYEYPGISLSTEIYSDYASQIQPVNLPAIHAKQSAEDNEKHQDKVALKIIFKPEYCIGFVWPPYQCRLKFELANIEADPTELKIRRHINRPKKGKHPIHKLQSNQDLKLAFFPAGLNSDELQNYQHELPLYNCMPKYLKKMQRQYFEINGELKKKLD